MYFTSVSCAQGVKKISFLYVLKVYGVGDLESWPQNVFGKGETEAKRAWISILCCIVLLFNQVYETKSLVQHNSDAIKELLNKNQKDNNDLSQEIFYEYGKSIKKLFSLLSLGQ